MRFYYIRTIVYIILFLVTTPKAFGQQLTPITKGTKGTKVGTKESMVGTMGSMGNTENMGSMVVWLLLFQTMATIRPNRYRCMHVPGMLVMYYPLE